MGCSSSNDFDKTSDSIQRREPSRRSRKRKTLRVEPDQLISYREARNYTTNSNKKDDPFPSISKRMR